MLPQPMACRPLKLIRRPTGNSTSFLWVGVDRRIYRENHILTGEIDIQMPNMDGMVASYEIRKFEQQNLLSRKPIIALTGLASTDAREQASLSGIDIFLTKPVPLKKVKAVLEEHFPSPGTNG